MQEEDVVIMEKKPSARNSSVPPKNGASETKAKSDNGSNGKPARRGKRREGNVGRSFQENYPARRPSPQTTRNGGDKRPRARGYGNDRSRDEVTDGLRAEYDSALNVGPRKTNLNHLLNFTFTPRDNYDGVGKRHDGGRRRHRSSYRAAYNKERFLQANCQFIVKPLGSYAIHSSDPDTLVDWDMIEQVRVSGHESPSCPICREIPAAAKITRCGHIYCWACILHYLVLGEKSWRKCPICYEAVHQSDLKSVKVVDVPQCKEGETIKMQLMKRNKGSTYAVPNCLWNDSEGKPHTVMDVENVSFLKVLEATLDYVQHEILDMERAALACQLADAEISEVCFIESALTLLQERENLLKGNMSVLKSDKHILESLNASDTEPSYPLEDVNPPVSTTKSEDSTSQQTVEQSNPGVGSKGKPIMTYASAFSDDEEEVIPKVSKSSDDHSDEANVLSSDGDAHSDSSDHGSVQSAVNSDDNIAETKKKSAKTTKTNAGKAESTHASREDTSTIDEVIDAPSPAVGVKGKMTDTPMPAEAVSDHMPLEEAAEHLELPPEMEMSRSGKRTGSGPKDTFYYYQAADGQYVFLNALNARSLIREYGSLENCPDMIEARIVETEAIFMTEELRRRLRYLSHLPLTCEFEVVELALKPPLVSKETIRYFSDEIEYRRRKRQKKSREERRQARKIEEEENRKLGIFPNARPATYDGHKGGSRASAHGSSSTSSANTPDDSTRTITLDPNAAEFVPGSPEEETSGSMSFAQMLRGGSAKPVVWPKAQKTEQVSPGPRDVKVKAAGSEESENEDRVPVPMFQASFGDAFQIALDNLGDKKQDDKEGLPGVEEKSKKKKKQKQKLLFSTSMAFGK